MKTFNKLAVIFLINAFAVNSCRQDEVITKEGLNALYFKYKNGSISECKLNEQTVYSAGINAFDASAHIYDINGKKIGICSWSTNKVDTICYQLKNCETIYRCKNHLSGLPFVDKYGLGK